MKTRILLAMLVPIGACKADHSLGSIEPDSGPGASPQLDTAGPTTASGGGDAAPSIGLDSAPIGPLGAVESWTGWAQNYQFPSGSDAIKLSFASDPNGVVVGQVTLGSGTPPPPATDPNVGYPGEKDMYARLPLEGFPYTMYKGTIAPNRLRFTVQLYEPWTGWCALQTPATDGSSSCMPDAPPGEGYGSDGDTCFLVDASFAGPSPPLAYVNCARLGLCPVCTCSATSCRVLVPEDVSEPFLVAPPMTSFDMAISGNIAMGSMNGANIYLTKDQ
jgi:hypothetical protein